VAQIYGAVVETVMRWCQEYGPTVAWAVVLLLAGGLGLRILYRVLQYSRSRPPS
jgi:uncharacterized protein (TIGR03382 family)